jgi:hypothetical protein
VDVIEHVKQNRDDGRAAQTQDNRSLIHPELASPARIICPWIKASSQRHSSGSQGLFRMLNPARAALKIKPDAKIAQN